MLRLLALIAIGAAPAACQEKAIDVERSTITVHVGKAGLLSAAGHEHWVTAPIASGVINEADPGRVEFRVEAAKMVVKPDPKVDAKTEAEIQKDMQEKALESARYPEIVFRSAHVEKQGAGRWKVDGTLNLHGVSKPVSVVVGREGEAYTGRAVLKQTDFGMKPISAAGGTVKVKNELDLEFRIVTRQ